MSTRIMSINEHGKICREKLKEDIDGHMIELSDDIDSGLVDFVIVVGLSSKGEGVFISSAQSEAISISPYVVMGALEEAKLTVVDQLIQDGSDG